MLFFLSIAKVQTLYQTALTRLYYCITTIAFFFLWTLLGEIVVGVWQGGDRRRFFANCPRFGKIV
jgi:hypothetical protein